MSARIRPQGDSGRNTRDSGRLDVEIEGGPGFWPVPRVALAEDDSGPVALAYRYGGAGLLAQATADLLTSFVALWTGGPDDVLDFATKYGVLGLCEEHRLPTRVHDPHPRSCGPQQFTADGETWLVEQITEWRWWSERAYQMVAAAAALEVADLTEEQWRMALWDVPPEKWRDAPLGERKRLAAFTVSSWLIAGGGVTSVIDVDASDNPYWRLTPHSMFGGMALLVGQALTGFRKWDVCSVCVRMHERSRRARLGEGVYCAGCQKRGAARRAAKSRAKGAAPR